MRQLTHSTVAKKRGKHSKSIDSRTLTLSITYLKDRATIGTNTMKIKFTHKKNGKTKSAVITQEKYFSYLASLHQGLGIPMVRLISDKARVTEGEVVRYANHKETIIFEKVTP